MEHCYRIALWMFCFVACIQARPTVPFSVPTEDDLRLDDIKPAECGNATFLSQPLVEADKCVAVKCIIHELKRASANCTLQDDIMATVEELENTMLYPTPAPTSSSECKWETRKSFKDFVDDVESFFQSLRDNTN